MDIFRDDQDRSTFVRLLEQHLQPTGIRCYAWALQPNHFHLVLRTAEEPLATLMKPLNSRYATCYNRRYRRRGYLFQDRFKSVATQEQLYIQELVRYVHLNPIRAGQCATLADLAAYPWCGHAALMGTRANSFQDTQAVLRCFGKREAEARRAYCEFLRQGLADENDVFPPTVRDGTHGGTDRSRPSRWVIGDPEFVRLAVRRDRQRRLRIARHVSDGWDLDRLCAVAAKAVGVRPVELKARSHVGPVSNGRRILAHLAHRELDVPVVEVARYLGVSGSAVSQMLREGRTLATKCRVTLT